MAINQFSRPHQFQKYTDPFDLTVFSKVLTDKESRFEQGAQSVQKGIDDLYSQLQVTRDVDQKYINDKINGLTEQINDLGSQDFSDPGVLSQIKGMSRSITGDKNIINAVYSTKAIQSKLDQIKNIKEKHPEYYSADNEADAMSSVNDYLNNRQLGVKYHDTTPFSPYYDYNKEKNDLVEQFYKMPSGFTQEVNDGAGHIVTMKYTGKSPDMLQKYLSANLSDKSRNQLAIEGRVRTDHIDPDTFYNDVYVPSRAPEYLENQDQIKKLSQQKAKEGDSDKIADLDNQIAQLEKKNQDIESSMGRDKAKVLANKREIGGQINVSRYIQDVAASVAIPALESVTSKEDKAYFDQLHAATEMARTARASTTGSGKPKATPTQEGTFSDGRVYSDTQIIDTKDQDTKSSYEDFKTQKDALWNNIVSDYTPLFAKFVSQKAAQQGLSTADALGHYEEYRQEFANQVKANIDKYKKNPNDSTIPPDLRAVIAKNVRGTDLYLDMGRYEQNAVDRLAHQAQQAGIKPTIRNGVMISVRDKAEKALTGHNDNIDLYGSTSGGLNEQQARLVGSRGPGVSLPAIPGQSIEFAQGFYNAQSLSSGKPVADIRDDLRKMQPAAQEALNSFNRLITQEQPIWSIIRDDKNPDNARTLNYYSNLIGNYIDQGAEVRDAAGRRVKGLSIDPSKISYLTVNDVTGNVTFNVPAKAKDGSGVTQTVEARYTIALPEAVRDFTEEKYYQTRLFLNDGAVPMTSAGKKPIAYTLKSTGTKDTNYTLDESGSNALYYPTINGIKPKDFPPQARPEDVVTYMNNRVTLSQQDKVQQIVDENKRLYDEKYGAGAWSRLPHEYKREVAKELQEEVVGNLKESDSFILNDDGLEDINYD